MFASRKHLLAQALQRSGSGAVSLVQGLGWGQRIDWDKSQIIVRQYDPADQVDVNSPYNTTNPVGGGPRGFHVEGFVYQEGPGPRVDYELRIRTNDQDDAASFFTQYFFPWPGGAWDSPSYANGVLTIADTWHDRKDADLCLLWLFGFNVFI